VKGISGQNVLGDGSKTDLERGAERKKEMKIEFKRTKWGKRES